MFTQRDESSKEEPVAGAGAGENLILLVATQLPSDAFYRVLLFLSRPTAIGPFLATSIAPLCSLTWTCTKRSDDLWGSVKNGYSRVWDEAYANAPQYHNRSDVRSHREDVIRTHKLIRTDTEAALRELELVVESEKQSLSLTRLKKIFRKHISHGSYIDVNQRSTNGETFLTCCCDASFVSERIIQNCVKWLVKEKGALPDVPSDSGYQRHTALAIAAARGMPTVVTFLLEHGADMHRRIKGQFGLASERRKKVTGNLTPLGFARAIQKAELANGAHLGDPCITALDRCIRILEGERKIIVEEILSSADRDISILEIDLNALRIG